MPVLADLPTRCGIKPLRPAGFGVIEQFGPATTFRRTSLRACMRTSRLQFNSRMPEYVRMGSLLRLPKEVPS